MDTNPPIELSDDENNQNDHAIMPPPAIVPLSKPTKEKKAPAEKKIRSTRSKQKKTIVSFKYYLFTRCIPLFAYDCILYCAKFYFNSG